VYFDMLTLAAVADELRKHAKGGRVQRVVRPTDLSLGLEVYSGERHQLLISAEPDASRMHLTRQRVRRGTEAPSPLELLLRKYVLGSRLEAIDQPHLERILILRFGGPEGQTALVCEIMGRYSNIVLVNADGLILDALKRVPPSINRYRSILPQHEYVPPPPQDKEDPLLLTPGILQRLLTARDEPLLWRRLVSTVAGVSPIAARELVYRATGRVATKPDELTQEHLTALVEAARDLYSLPRTHAWTPCVAYENPQEHLPTAFAPYPLTHYAAHDPAAGISEAIEAVLAARMNLDPYRGARGRLLALIDDRIERAERRLESLRRSLVPEEEIDELQRQGNAILSMAWSIEPGQTELVVEPAMLGRGAEGTGLAPVRIPLDPRLSAVENAQELFQRYRKLKDAAEQVPALIRRVEQDLQYLRQVRTDAVMAEDRPGLEDVERELREAGHLPEGRHPKSGPRQEPLKISDPDGVTILVGRSSRQNDEVTFRLSSPDDIWLHAHGVPGAHVIIRSGGSKVAEETLRRAAQLAAYYSAAREERRVQVDYTERRYVRPIRGAGPGMVTYREERTLLVEPKRED